MTASTAPFSLRPMARADEEGVQTLWTQRFGGRASNQEKWIDAAVDSSHSVTGLVATVQPDDAVVGFSLLEVGNRTYTRKYLGLDSLSLDPPLDDQNGLFHLSCVQTDWEGRGIGSAFYKRRLEVLADRDVPRVFGIAWHRPHTVDSRGLFEKWGFTAVASVERYYARTGGRANCPDCNGACSCTASLYTRPIEPSE